MSEVKLKAWDYEKQCFVPQGEIIFHDYGDTRWSVSPNDLSYIGDQIHNGEPIRERFRIIRNVNLSDGNGFELWEGDLRKLNGKLYKVVDEGFRFSFERNLVQFGENEMIVLDEDTAWSSQLIGNIFENQSFLH